MANSISHAEIYTRLFAGLADEAYKAEAKSLALIRPANLINNFDEQVKTFKMRTLTTSGNYNYARATGGGKGYTDGDITSGWNSYTVAIDRGVSLGLDILDSAEALMLQMAEVGDNYLRYQDIPETDAYVFAKIASKAGKTDTADVTTSTDVVALFETALTHMAKKEVSTAIPKIIYASPTTVAAYRNQMRTKLLVTNADMGMNTLALNYNGIPIVEVPDGRFADTVTLLNTGTGGFSIPETIQADAEATPPVVGSEGAKQLNFMIVALDAAFVFSAYSRRMRFIPWEQNKDSDNNILLSRHFYDAFVIDNRKHGVYVHKAKTPIGGDLITTP